MVTIEKEPIQIVEVSNVQLIKVTNKNKREIHIRATGFSKADGWEKPRLELRNPYWKPIDGIYEFDFLGSAPSNGSVDRLEKMFVALDWNQYPMDIKGIRVYAGKNSMLKML